MKKYYVFLYLFFFLIIGCTGCTDKEQKSTFVCVNEMEGDSIENTVEVISTNDIIWELTETAIYKVDTDQDLKDIKKFYEEENQNTGKRICGFFKNCKDYYLFSIEIIGRGELKVSYTFNFREAMKIENGMNVMTNTNEYKKGDYLSYELYVQRLRSNGYKIKDKYLKVS